MAYVWDKTEKLDSDVTLPDAMAMFENRLPLELLGVI